MQVLYAALKLSDITKSYTNIKNDAGSSLCTCFTIPQGGLNNQWVADPENEEIFHIYGTDSNSVKRKED